MPSTGLNQNCGEQIWITGGTYIPGRLDSSTFSITGGVSIYGGFAGDETSVSERSGNNRTFLSGDNICTNIISIPSDANEVVLDGLTITAAIGNAVNCGASNDLAIKNCHIFDNTSAAVSAGYNSDLVIDHCVIADNGSGVYLGSGLFTMTNCWVNHNSSSGVNLNTCSSGSEIRNCTIAYNSSTGISGSTGNLSVENDILWGNNSSGTQFSGGCLPFNSCFNNGSAPCEDPDPNYANIYCDPCFAYDDETLGNFHLSADSPCIDASDNTNVITGETDIDNEDRINGTYVDMGADEYYSCDSGISCTLDYNADGVVNLKEFALFEKAWHNYDPATNNDPNKNYDTRCDLDNDQYIDLDNDQYIDLDDLMIFVDSTNAETFGYWLWQACWYDSDSTAVAMMRTASIPEATILTDEQIKSNRQAKWQKNQPEREYTTYETMLMVEDIIEIIENDWLTNPDFQKEVSEEQYKESMQMLYDWLDELLTEWKTELSAVSKTAS